MVGNITSGQSFSQLSWYLAGKNPDRVAWIATRNTSENDALEVAKEMSDVAAKSDRVEKPVYHVSISMDPGDELSTKQLEQVADQTLKDLGLEDHQAAFVAHNDTDHNHVHLMVNRVHPGTEKAWEMWRDRDHLKSSLERQEKELGVRLTGNNLPEREGYRQISQRISKEHKQRTSIMARDTDTRQRRPNEVQNYSLDFRQKLEAARQVVEQAGSSEELRHGLRKQGLDVETSGDSRGAEVVNANDRNERINVRDLNEAYRKGRLVPEGSKDVSNRTKAGASVKEKVMGNGKSRSGSAGALKGEAVRAGTAVAREALEPMEEESDTMKKAARLIALAGRMAERLQRRRQRQADRDDASKDETTHEAGSEKSRVDRAEEAIHRYREQRGLENDHQALSQQVEDAEDQLETYESRREQIEDARRKVDDAVGKAYNDPDAARGNIRESTEKHGADQTAEDLRQRPERFGDMPDTGEARDAAERAADGLEDAAGKMSETPPASHVEKLQERAQESRDQLSEAEREIGDVAHSENARQEVGRRMADLNEREAEDVKTHIDDEADMDMAREARQEYRTRQTKRDVTAYQETKQMERQRRENTQLVSEGEKQLEKDGRVQDKFETAEREFESNLKEAYQNPDDARQEFNWMAEQQSARKASKQMRRDPGSFGDLKVTKRSKMMGLPSETDTTPAEEAASAAANRGKTTRQLRDRAMTKEARTSLKEKVAGAQESSREITKALKQRASAKSLKKQLGQRLGNMSEQARKSAVRSLSSNGKRIAQSAMKTVGLRAVEATRDKERGRGL